MNNYWDKLIDYILPEKEMMVEKNSITKDIIKCNIVVYSISSQDHYESCKRYICLLEKKYSYDGNTISPKNRDRTLGLFLIAKEASRELLQLLNNKYSKDNENKDV